jgi:putative protease
LCGLEFIPNLIKAGVMCFKIEGRMKSPEYVATVTRIYRKYIDLALSNKPYVIDENDKRDLLQVFNRGGFSSGHLSTNPNKDLVYNKKPNHMGIYIGNVSNFKQNKGHIFLNLTDSISIGDTITFENEPTKYTVSELMVKGKNITTADKKELVEIGRMKGNIHIGDKIYKVASKELSNQAKLSYESENKKIQLLAHVKVHKQEPIELTVTTVNGCNSIFDNISITKKTEIVPVEANSKPVDEQRIIAQISKTNNTIFNFENIEIDLEENTFIPSISELNELRRNCLDELLYIANSKIIRKGKNVKLELSNTKNKKTNNKEISILINEINIDEDYTKLTNVDNLYIPLKYFSNKKFDNKLLELSNLFNLYIYLPTVIKSNYKNLLNNVVENSINKYNIKGFVVSNISSYSFINEFKNKYTFIANYTLNMYNNYTEDVLSKFGVSRVTLSPELNSSIINSICDNKHTFTELIVYGRTPLMTSNYCLLGKTNKCYPTCGSKCSENIKYYLKDRLGFSFRIVPDNTQTVTTIYNSKITSINGVDFNVNSYRIDILDESVDEINSIVQTVLSGNRLEGKDYTNGNLNREI